jgi:hypothetical protein
MTYSWRIRFESASGRNEIVQVSCVGVASQVAQAVRRLVAHP